MKKLIWKIKRAVRNSLTLQITLIVILVLILWNSTAYRDIEYLKSESSSFLEDRGFTVVSYDGYCGEPFHGGFTYYQVRDKNDYLYSLAIGSWRGDIMIYEQECLNAVSSTK